MLTLNAWMGDVMGQFLDEVQLLPGWIGRNLALVKDLDERAQAAEVDLMLRRKKFIYSLAQEEGRLKNRRRQLRRASETGSRVEVIRSDGNERVDTAGDKHRDESGVEYGEDRKCCRGYDNFRISDGQRCKEGLALVDGSESELSTREPTSESEDGLNSVCSSNSPHGSITRVNKCSKGQSILSLAEDKCCFSCNGANGFEDCKKVEIDFMSSEIGKLEIQKLEIRPHCKTGGSQPDCHLEYSKAQIADEGERNPKAQIADEGERNPSLMSRPDSEFGVYPGGSRHLWYGSRKRRRVNRLTDGCEESSIPDNSKNPSKTRQQPQDFSTIDCESFDTRRGDGLQDENRKICSEDMDDVNERFGIRGRLAFEKECLEVVERQQKDLLLDKIETTKQTLCLVRHHRMKLQFRQQGFLKLVERRQDQTTNSTQLTHSTNGTYSAQQQTATCSSQSYFGDGDSKKFADDKCLFLGHERLGSGRKRRKERSFVRPEGDGPNTSSSSMGLKETKSPTAAKHPNLSTTSALGFPQSKSSCSSNSNSVVRQSRNRVSSRNSNRVNTAKNCSAYQNHVPGGVGSPVSQTSCLSCDDSHGSSESCLVPAVCTNTSVIGEQVNTSFDLSSSIAVSATDSGEENRCGNLNFQPNSEGRCPQYVPSYSCLSNDAVVDLAETQKHRNPDFSCNTNITQATYPSLNFELADSYNVKYLQLGGEKSRLMCEANTSHLAGGCPMALENYSPPQQRNQDLGVHTRSTKRVRKQSCIESTNGSIRFSAAGKAEDNLFPWALGIQNTALLSSPPSECSTLFSVASHEKEDKRASGFPFGVCGSDGCSSVAWNSEGKCDENGPKMSCSSGASSDKITTSDRREEGEIGISLPPPLLPPSATLLSTCFTDDTVLNSEKSGDGARRDNSFRSRTYHNSNSMTGVCDSSPGVDRVVFKTENHQFNGNQLISPISRSRESGNSLWGVVNEANCVLSKFDSCDENDWVVVGGVSPEYGSGYSSGNSGGNDGGNSGGSGGCNSDGSGGNSGGSGNIGVGGTEAKPQNAAVAQHIELGIFPMLREFDEHEEQLENGWGGIRRYPSTGCSSGCGSEEVDRRGNRNRGSTSKSTCERAMATVAEGVPSKVGNCNRGSKHSGRRNSLKVVSRFQSQCSQRKQGVPSQSSTASRKLGNPTAKGKGRNSEDPGQSRMYGGENVSLRKSTEIAEAKNSDEPKAVEEYEDPNEWNGKCPACGNGEAGQDMVACDSCNGWFHFACVGYEETDEDWYCVLCINSSLVPHSAQQNAKQNSKILVD